MHSICATAMIWTLMHMTKELSLIWNICLSCGWTTAILVNDMHGSNTIWGLSFALEKTIYTHPMSCIPIFISRPLSTNQGIFMPKLLFENFRNVTQQVYFSSYIVDPSFGLLPLKFSNIIYDQTYGSINANSSNDYFTFTAPTGIVSFTFAWATLDYSDIGNFLMVTVLKCWWQNHFVGDIFKAQISPPSLFKAKIGLGFKSDWFFRITDATWCTRRDSLHDSYSMTQKADEQNANGMRIFNA